MTAASPSPDPAGGAACAAAGITSAGGERTCKKCAERLPLARFLPRPVRYACRRCFYAMQRPSKARARLLQDARRIAERHFAGADPSLVAPCAAHHLRMLPRDPLRPLAADNVLLCTPAQRAVLLALWRERADARQYEQAAGMLVSCG